MHYFVGNAPSQNRFSLVHGCERNRFLPANSLVARSFGSYTAKPQDAKNE
jgi:hypothetical protein